METAKIELTGCPPSMNALPANRYAKNRIKQEWGEYAGWMAKAAKLNICERFVKVHITFLYNDKRIRDKDNMAWGVKAIVDGLKGIVIVDDSTRHIDLDWDLAMGAVETKTVIEIEEVN